MAPSCRVYHVEMRSKIRIATANCNKGYSIVSRRGPRTWRREGRPYLLEADDAPPGHDRVAKLVKQHVEEDAEQGVVHRIDQPRRLKGGVPPLERRVRLKALAPRLPLPHVVGLVAPHHRRHSADVLPLFPAGLGGRHRKRRGPALERGGHVPEKVGAGDGGVSQHGDGALELEPAVHRVVHLGVVGDAPVGDLRLDKLGLDVVGPRRELVVDVLELVDLRGGGRTR